MPVLVTCKFDEDRIESEGASVPIISQWEITVAMATTVLIGHVPKSEFAVAPHYRCNT